MENREENSQRFGKYGRKKSRIVIRYEQYGGKPS
jgi:hypothetical protein